MIRLDALFDSLYILSSLSGAFDDRPNISGVCSSVTRDRQVVYALSSSWVPETAAKITAFVKVNVIPMDAERILERQTVLVENGRITALGPAKNVPVPAGALRIDGRGKYLMPGLGEMHEHSLDENHTMDALFRFLADGTTTIRYIDSGDLSTKQRMAKIPGPHPRAYVGIYLRDLVPYDKRSSLDSIPARIAAHKAMGYDFLKIDMIPSVGSFDDSALTIAGRIKFPVAEHTHGQEDVLRLGAYGASNEHMMGYRQAFEPYLSGDKMTAEIPTSTIDSLAIATRRVGVWNTPTLNCVTRVQGWEKSKSKRFLTQMVKALANSGSRLLLGSDAGGGNIHDELAAMVYSAGLTPYQALLAGTRNVAEYFGVLNEAGTVAIGKRADLVLLYGNPLENIRYAREPAGVMIDGEWLDRTALDRRLMNPPPEASRPSRGTKVSPWPLWAIERIASPGFTKEQFQRLQPHHSAFEATTDSLVSSKEPSVQQPLRQRLANELSAMRVILIPQQYETFDPAVRVWLREQVRQGHDLTISGVSAIP